MKAEPLHRRDEVVGIPRIHLWPTLDCLAHEAGQFNASPGDLSGLRLSLDKPPRVDPHKHWQGGIVPFSQR